MELFKLRNKKQVKTTADKENFNTMGTYERLRVRAIRATIDAEEKKKQKEEPENIL